MVLSLAGFAVSYIVMIALMVIFSKVNRSTVNKNFKILQIYLGGIYGQPVMVMLKKLWV